MSSVPATNIDDVTIDLGALVRALWRARVWIVPLVIAAAVASFVGLSLMPPTYKADARLVVEARDLAIGAGDRQAEVERSVLDEQGVGSQVQLITSRDIARHVVETENLVDDPEYHSFLTGLLGRIGIGAPGTGSGEERVLEAFLDHLNVFQVEKSRVIQVEFTSRDPRKAARITTAIIDEYRRVSAEAKSRTSADATRWLATEIDALRKKVADAEAKVEQYRAGADLFVGQNNVKISEQQLGELNSQLTAMRGQRSETEARVRQLKRLLDSGSGNLETAAEVTASPLIQRLRERQVALRARAAELSTTYLSNHPMVQAVVAQTADVERQIRVEAAKILAGYENELKVADGRIKQLDAQLNEFKSLSAKAGEEDIQLRALEREAKVQRDQLEEFLARYRDGIARQSVGAQIADARIISAATVPAKPSFPKVLPLTSIITLAVFLLAVTWVVLREFLSGNVLRQASVAPPPPFVPPVAGEAPAVVSAPVAPVPALPPASLAESVGPAIPASSEPSHTVPAPVEATDGGDVAPLPHELSATPEPPVMTEPAIERIWREISASATDGQRILVTSATSDHAAHIGALALLRTAARGGGKVCLVDLVGEVGALAELVGAEEGAGLSDLLAGRAGFSQVICRDRVSRGHVVVSGTEPLTPETLDGDDLDAALDALDLTYDHLVLDMGLIAAGEGAAALLASADAVVLASDGIDADPRTAKTHEMLLAGHKAVWILAVGDGAVVSLADAA